MFPTEIYRPKVKHDFREILCSLAKWSVRRPAVSCNASVLYQPKPKVAAPAAVYISVRFKHPFRRALLLLKATNKRITTSTPLKSISFRQPSGLKSVASFEVLNLVVMLRCQLRGWLQIVIHFILHGSRMHTVGIYSAVVQNYRVVLQAAVTGRQVSHYRN